MATPETVAGGYGGAPSGGYVQVANERMFLGPDRFLVQAGSPSISGAAGTGAQPGVLMDAASQEVVTAGFFVPIGWTTCDIDLWWLNNGAGSGDVRWRIQMVSHANGSDTVTSVADQSRTETAAAQNVQTQRASFIAAAAVSSSLIYRISVLRVAADVADTLGNDAAFLGLMIRRIS